MWENAKITTSDVSHMMRDTSLMVCEVSLMTCDVSLCHDMLCVCVCVRDTQVFQIKLKLRGSGLKVLQFISETMCSKFEGPRWQAGN